MQVSYTYYSTPLPVYWVPGSPGYGLDPLFMCSTPLPVYWVPRSPGYGLDPCLCTPRPLPVYWVPRYPGYGLMDQTLVYVLHTSTCVLGSTFSGIWTRPLLMHSTTSTCVLGSTFSGIWTRPLLMHSTVSFPDFQMHTHIYKKSLVTVLGEAAKIKKCIYFFKICP